MMPFWRIIVIRENYPLEIGENINNAVSEKS